MGDTDHGTGGNIRVDDQFLALIGVRVEQELDDLPTGQAIFAAGVIDVHRVGCQDFLADVSVLMNLVIAALSMDTPMDFLY